MRLHPNKSRNAARHNVLHVRVWSTRIVRIACFKMLFRSFKPLCLLALLAIVGLGIRQGVCWALYDNPDFRLQVVDLNPNAAIDELDFAKLTGINLRANLFRLDREALTKCLTNLPQLADAQVQRQLPGTLVVRVTARTPRAWIACPTAGLPATRVAGGILVDDHDIAYPCPPRQLETAATLPIIVLPARDKQPIAVGKKILQPELQRCLRLLTSANASDPEAAHWIDSIQQANAWSLWLTTSGGTVATLGLSDHARQVANLRAAIKHAEIKGYAMATINLIPKENVPITIASAHLPPPVTAPDPEPVPEAESEPSPACAAPVSNDTPVPKSIPKTSPAETPKRVTAVATAATPDTVAKTTTKEATKSAPRAIPVTAPRAIPVAIPKAIPKAVPVAVPKSVPRAIPVAIPVPSPASKTSRQDRHSRDQKNLPNRD